jgi:acetyl esterase/lipase
VDDLHFKPSNISLSGDSAGGHLVNCLVRYLVEGGEETPGKIVLISVSISRDSMELTL